MTDPQRDESRAELDEQVERRLADLERRIDALEFWREYHDRDSVGI